MAHYWTHRCATCHSRLAFSVASARRCGRVAGLLLGFVLLPLMFLAYTRHLFLHLWMLVPAIVIGGYLLGSVIFARFGYLVRYEQAIGSPAPNTYEHPNV